MPAPEAPLLYQGVARSSAAFRLLKQMGWQEGEGLGKEKQGIREHVRVSKKSDNSGVGVDAQQKAATNWAFNTTAFDNILKKLNVIVSADTSLEGDIDKQIEEAAHDLKHTKSSSSKKLTRPQGRYKKREDGKLLKGKSQADLDAILGLSHKPPREVWPVPNESRAIDEKSTVVESSCVPPETLAEGNDTRPEVHPPGVMNVEQSTEEMPSVNIPIDWWGTQFGFVAAGALGLQTRDRKLTADLEPTLSSKTRMSFCEQDQEDLYKLVQDKATKGRQGLGIADRPKKIGGANWKGQKVILDNNDDDAENDEVVDVQENTTGTGDIVHETGERKRKADGENGRNPKQSRQDRTFRWKKVCARLLQEAPAHTMKMKDLQRLIVEESCLCTGWSSHSSQQPSNFCKGKLKEKLMKSSKFVIEGKKVSLAVFS